MKVPRHRQLTVILSNRFFLSDKAQASSPRSAVSQIDNTRTRDKAHEVLTVFVSILGTGSNLAKLSAALPLPRICLLLLGDHPTSIIATQILTIISLAQKSSTSFSRKFELVSGWTVLKVALPSAWNTEVQAVAFDILLGRTAGQERTPNTQRNPIIACSQIAPAIFAALDYGLAAVVRGDDSYTGMCAFQF